MIVQYLNGLYHCMSIGLVLKLCYLFSFNEFPTSAKKKKKKKTTGFHVWAGEKSWHRIQLFHYQIMCSIFYFLQFPLIFTLNLVISLSDYLSIWHPHYWFAQNFTHKIMMINFPIHNIGRIVKYGPSWILFSSLFHFSPPNQIKES